MKWRLITNGVLSLLLSIMGIVLLGSIVSALGTITEINNSKVNFSGEDVFNSIKTEIIGGVSTLIFMIFLRTACLVMGIVTLAMEKSESAKGLTIASGVLAILGGVFFSGAIVSFIGAYKIHSLNKKELMKKVQQK